ncbi:hypothetical protein FPZ12_030505 [Amycolatopsis acidicola]|uniref:Uncharacterized protein n=1 Tax=Amycolatopsis acidicola TaxID=2596893 RepID=A0A5N0UWK9_9PSEU|nr:hypothetical protein [Amycolatopsis acidicola]KAA9155174.1 hypothetical protein FPZ12_030505 [Amycolatopsis acidicola]
MDSDRKTAPRDPANWKTPTMRRLESELDGIKSLADSAIARANKVRVTERRPSDEEVDRLRQAAEHPRAPESLRQLKELVDRGRFSWRDIAEGRAFSNPDVVQAYVDAGARVDPTVVRQIVADLEEGATPEDIVASRSAASRGDDDGEDGGFSVFENRFR